MNYQLQDRPCIECKIRPRQCGLPKLYCKQCMNERLSGRVTPEYDTGHCINTMVGNNHGPTAGERENY